MARFLEHVTALNVDAGMHGRKSKRFLIEQGSIMKLSCITQQIGPPRDRAGDTPAKDRDPKLSQGVQ
jgi:hypothetical protein